MYRTTLTLLLLLLVDHAYSQNGTLSSREQHEYDKNDLIKEYIEFRASVNQEYAEFMEMAWKSYGMKDPIPFPIKKWDEPIHYKKQEQKQGKEQEKGVEIKIASKPIVPLPTIGKLKNQPQPVCTIPEIKDDEKAYGFEYYGTPMKVRWANAASFKLAGTDKKSISDAYRKFSSSQYNNLLYDCLKIRKELTLCDWAYYKMLQALAESACGKGTNEAVFLQGFLYQQSGYMMRFGLDDQRNLHLLVRINGAAYRSGYTSINGQLFFLFDGSKLKNLNVCEMAYPGEKIMQLDIEKLPKLDVDLSDNRTVISRFVSVQADIAVNKNIINFFNDYPSTYKENNIMTNWAYYANTPISDEVKKNVYPQLKEQIKNGTKLMGANLLLNWVQMGLDYAKDPVVWGYERAFFAEESLFYPKCDCEDRAILYSRLIRDLLGLDVVLIYYPEHVYTAICFNEPVDGDYIMVEGRKFVVADPTYYSANVGRTMSRMDNGKAEIILLNKDL